MLRPVDDGRRSPFAASGSIARASEVLGERTSAQVAEATDLDRRETCVTDTWAAVAVCADEKFAMMAAAALSSAMRRGRWPLGMPVIMLDAGITNTSRAKIERAVALTGHKLQWIELDQGLLSGVAGIEWLSHASNGRLVLPELLPRVVRRLIYIDADMVVRSSLLPLLDADMGGRTALACRNHGDWTVSDCEVSEPLLSNGMLTTDPYFNSGLLVVDVERWQALAVGRRCLALLRKGAGFRLGDQDALNVALREDWLPLSQNWNVVAKDPGSLSPETRIVHFVGLKKPTDPGYRRPARALFYEAVAESGWFTPTQYWGWRIAMEMPTPELAGKTLLRSAKKVRGLARRAVRFELGKAPWR